MSYSYLFDGIESKGTLISGKKVRLINFDNGATTPPVKAIYEKMPYWIANYGPIGRGTGQKGDQSAALQEGCKEKIKNFLGVENNPNYDVVFVKNTTEGLNLLAAGLIKDAGKYVVTTRMEHHSNDLPWRKAGKVKYLEVDKNGRIDLNELEKMLYYEGGLVSYVSVTGASNVTGYINPIYEIAAICHDYDAKIIVDAAQLIAHSPIYLQGYHQNEYIDFIVFSGHKMYAPFGSGVVVGRFREAYNLVPPMIGGGTVERVGDESYILGNYPEVLEAGTQNLMGNLAIGEAIDVLSQIGFEQIVEHENQLKNYMYQELKKIHAVELYGDCTRIHDRLAIIPFNIKGKCYMEVATRLAEEFGIATRGGKFCAHPYVDRLLKEKDYLMDYYGHYGMVRASLGLYNTVEEVDRFLDAIEYLSYH